MAIIRLGDYNQLEVVKEVDFGMYLDAGDEGEVLLPKRGGSVYRRRKLPYRRLGEG